MTPGLPLMEAIEISTRRSLPRPVSRPSTVDGGGGLDDRDAVRRRVRRDPLRVGVVDHQGDEHLPTRAGVLHQVTKRLATGWAVVGVEDLNVAGLTASARGTSNAPGRNVAAKAGLNRGILDRAFGELRRQLAYKTSWYGSEPRVIDRWAPTSQVCSACGRRDPSLLLSQRTYRCPTCGLVMDRDVNAARNIAQLVVDPAAWHAAVASGSGETSNARRGRVSPLPPHLAVEWRVSSSR
ncbi:RNA-guided endonuclease InsQ/TnpB family protein [Nocardioides zeae]